MNQFLSKLSTIQPQKGQVLIVVVLVLVTALTIGLSVASRSVTNTKLSSEEEQSKKAFSAAEAGIEQSLKSSSNSSGVFSGSGSSNSSFTAAVSQVSGTLLINDGSAVPKNDGVDIWLSHYPDFTSPMNGTLSIYWGSSSDDCSEAAIEVVIISGTLLTPVTTHYAFDPCASRVISNGFDQVSSSQTTLSNKTFYYQRDINYSSGLIARVVPLYANTPIGATGVPALPQQGNLIDSTGTAGETQRKIRVFKGYPKVPTEFFPYILFSP